jgi:iron-sulfur cluster assembly accessory protein
MVMVTKTAAGSLPEISVIPESIPAPPPIVTEDISVTQSCINRIQALVRKRQDAVKLQDIYLRVYVDAGGCSGFQYKFELTQDKDEPIDPEVDIVYEADETRVVIDSASLDLIRGSTIDFTQEMIKSAFAVINNPQSESACGCGSSFAVKNFSSNPALD